MSLLGKTIFSCLVFLLAVFLAIWLGGHDGAGSERYGLEFTAAQRNWITIGALIVGAIALFDFIQNILGLIFQGLFGFNLFGGIKKVFALAGFAGMVYVAWPVLKQQKVVEGLIGSFGGQG